MIDKCELFCITMSKKSNFCNCNKVLVCSYRGTLFHSSSQNKSSDAAEAIDSDLSGRHDCLGSLSLCD